VPANTILRTAAAFCPDLKSGDRQRSRTRKPVHFNNLIAPIWARICIVLAGARA